LRKGNKLIITRNIKDFGFNETVQNAVDETKCMVDYKPKAEPKKLVYDRKPKVKR
jgi:hypothetical protein